MAESMVEKFWKIIRMEDCASETLARMMAMVMEEERDNYRWSIGDMLEALDGCGLILTDDDLIIERLSEAGLSLKDKVGR